MISRNNIAAAAARIGGHVRHTPVIRLNSIDCEMNLPVTLKLELLQHTGSFKPRGAFNRLLSASVPGAGVIAASGGNHGAAVAYAARILGVSAEIFVPCTTPATKVARIKSYGARVVQAGANYAEALAACRDRQAETGALEVHAYDHPDVLAGQGTVGREFEQDAPELTHLLVATGGGGLIGGIAAWYASSAEVVSVEPESCPTLHDALRAGHPVDAQVGGLAADSLGARQVGSLMFPTPPSPGRSACCGTGCAWLPNRAARPRSRRCSVARSRHQRMRRWACWCAVPTPIRRRLRTRD